MSAQPQEIEPSPEPLIIGLVQMGKMFSKHRETIARWVRTENFPAARLPNGTYCTSPLLIDEWLRSRCQAQEKRSNGARKVSQV